MLEIIGNLILYCVVIPLAICVWTSMFLKFIIISYGSAKLAITSATHQFMKENNLLPTNKIDDETIKKLQTAINQQLVRKAARSERPKG